MITIIDIMLVTIFTTVATHQGYYYSQTLQYPDIRMTNEQYVANASKEEVLKSGFLGMV